MIKVYYQNKFEKEKKYVFDIFFSEVLGLEYEVFFHEKEEYKICFEGNEIIINDIFFSNLNDNELYYTNSQNIPIEISTVKSNYAIENDIVIIYGDADIQVNENMAAIGIDLIASTFFMLTRWEEIAVKERDSHNRFIEKNMLSIRQGFNTRPVVNEYIFFLWNIMSKMGISNVRKSKKFQLFPTHDVDFLFKYDTLAKCCKVLLGDIFKRHSIKMFFSSFQDVFEVKILKEKDVFDTFDYLMDVSDSKGVKSGFYFMTGDKGERDVAFNIEDNRVHKLIKKILARNHNVGIHPTYNSYNDFAKLNSELEKLKVVIKEVTEGRQHFLRFENPQTWQNWEDNGLKVDSTIGFYENVGFRAGICQEYSLFNVITREKLKLKERPLMIMDTALRRITEDKEDFISRSLNIVNTVKRYNGDFVILWHNNNLTVNEWKGWSEVYLKLIEAI